LDPTAYSKHYELDRTHFWRIAKRRLVLEWIERHAPRLGSLDLLDIGGACSVVSADLSRYGRVTVVEPDAGMVQAARERLGVAVLQGSLPDALPVQGPFDIVTLLDVLEHVPEDTQSLQAIRRLLRPGGTLICTVPAFRWLWSDHDVALHHVRRYTRSQLCALLESAGLRVQRISYYTAFLLPALAIQRTIGKLKPRRKAPTYDVTVPHPAMNGLFGMTMALERLVLRYADLPIGSALIAVATRPAA
jgi:2-polyprenyl-3-methyl-5-hydroxy-6-metoxy-1,4-benzoquinol methylase